MEILRLMAVFADHFPLKKSLVLTKIVLADYM